MSNLYRIIQHSLAQHRAKPLFVVGEETITGDVLDAVTAQYANALTAASVRPGDRVAAQVEKSVENAFLYLACLRVGAVYLPLNSAYRAAEVAYFLRDAKPRIFVADTAREAELSTVAVAAGVPLLLTLDVHGRGSLPDLAKSQAMTAPVVERQDDDLAVICYTSGTTGRSKGAMITHGNLASNARTLVQLWGFTSDDTLLHALPLYHIHGLFVALHCALLSGATTLLLPKFDPKEVVPALERTTVMMGVPTFYTRLLAEPTFVRESARSVRLFVSGSAPLLPETFAAFEARTGQRILERYGMTETGMIASNPLRGERRAGTVGRPLPQVEVRVTDADGQALPANSIGNVEVRGPNVFKGYWQMPEKTAAEFRADGFFITGDLGQLESDGYLRLVGRAKDLIISGGLNVYPKEIEEAIDAIDGVAESAVFAIPHPDFGEAVGAAVTLKPHATLAAEEIIATLRPQLAAFKLPKRVFILPELPRNAMSKVQKAVLREWYKGEFVTRDT